MKHLKSLNMSYFQHLFIALGYSFWLFLAVIALMIHAFIPCWFERTGSNLVAKIHERMYRNGSHPDQV